MTNGLIELREKLYLRRFPAFAEAGRETAVDAREHILSVIMMRAYGQARR